MLPPSRTVVLIFSGVLALVVVLACAPDQTDGPVDVGPGAGGKGGSDAGTDLEPDCHDGWCLVPAGTFTMGALESEFGYTKSQNQVPVTLTRPFVLQQYELTQEQWIRFGWTNPSGSLSNGTGDCVAPECPVGQLTWFETVAYANELSKTHVPPLEVCYELTGCSGTIGEGEGMRCETVSITTPSVYDCAGFRLPTEAEWEFAARAGVTSAFYDGEITPRENTGDCFHEPALDSIAWYCDNAGPLTHPVGLKAPNQLGLHDTLGNAFEWVHSDYHNDGYGDVALTDPFGEMNANPERVFKGGGWNSPATRCRAAAHLHAAWWGKGLGVRLARTLAANEVW